MKKQVYNPFLPLDEYIPDGEPHLFDGRVYLFGSHDKEGGDTFCMLDYTTWSAPAEDLSDWTCHGTIYRAKQDPLWSEMRPHMYAPDAVRGNDGRYYLYYSLAGYRGRGGYNGPISVAVCDTPGGQYEYLGFVRNPDGSPLKRFVPFDPALLNDNGTIRLTYGTLFPFDEHENALNRNMFRKIQSRIFNKSPEEIEAEPGGVMGAVSCVLADDMLTVTSGPVRIIPNKVRGTSFAGHPFFEAASLRKIDDTYYFIYSSFQNHELCYATSRYPDRDYVYGGTIISNGDIGLDGRKPKARLNATGTNHGSIEKINGRWYVFHHRLTHNSGYSRQACAEPIQILADGSIPQVEITSCGLNGGPLRAEGVFPAPIACHLTNGRMPHLSNKAGQKEIPCVTSSDGERYIGGIRRGTRIGYKYFDFKGSVQLVLTTRGSGRGRFTVTDGTVLFGSVAVGPSEKWTRNGLIFSTEGTRPLNLTYKGSGDQSLLDLEFVPQAE